MPKECLGSFCGRFIDDKYDYCWLCVPRCSTEGCETIVKDTQEWCWSCYTIDFDDCPACGRERVLDPDKPFVVCYRCWVANRHACRDLADAA